MLTVKLQSGQYFLCRGSFESFKSKDKKPCLSTNIFASNVQKSLKPWCRVHESLHALPARAHVSSNSFRCLPLLLARPKVPAALRLALAARAATRVDRAHARWIRKSNACAANNACRTESAHGVCAPCIVYNKILPTVGIVQR